MRESIEAFGSASRPLTDVKEEPQDKDDDCQMIDDIEEDRISQGSPLPRYFSRWSYWRGLDVVS